MTDRSRDRDIWLADVLGAWDTLKPKTPPERADIAQALGFDATVLRERTKHTQPTRMDEPGVSDQRKETGSVARPFVGSDRLDSPIIPFTIELETDGPSTDAGSWTTPAKPLGQEQPAHHSWRPPHIPLLRPGWTRHIMSAIAAVHVEEGPLDERRLIEAVSNLRPVTEMPRRPRRTLRRGIQVLIDRGPAMLPFRSDVQDVITSLRTVVARDQLHAAAFEYTPAQADRPVLWLRDRRADLWRPPAAGTPILVVSDLGLSRQYGDTQGASTGEWLEFSTRCRAAGCPTAVLIPRGEGALPTALRRAFTLIPWDQRTNVGMVVRLLGDRDRR